jgi:hypothetical protein
MAHDMD